MCVQSPPVSITLKGLPLLPERPCFQRAPYKPAADIDEICLPFPPVEQSCLRLTLQLSHRQERGRVREVLHRMSSRSFNSQEEEASAEEESPAKVQSVDETIVERLSSLMQPEGKSASSTTGPGSKPRSSSPVPLARGMTRTHSGAALCA